MFIIVDQIHTHAVIGEMRLELSQRCNQGLLSVCMSLVYVHQGSEEAGRCS